MDTFRIRLTLWCPMTNGVSNKQKTRKNRLNFLMLLIQQRIIIKLFFSEIFSIHYNPSRKNESRSEFSTDFSKRLRPPSRISMGRNNVSFCDEQIQLTLRIELLCVPFRIISCLTRNLLPIGQWVVPDCDSSGRSNLKISHGKMENFNICNAKT